MVGHDQNLELNVPQYLLFQKGWQEEKVGGLARGKGENKCSAEEYLKSSNCRINLSGSKNCQDK